MGSRRYVDNWGILLYGELAHPATVASVKKPSVSLYLLKRTSLLFL